MAAQECRRRHASIVITMPPSDLPLARSSLFPSFSSITVTSQARAPALNVYTLHPTPTSRLPDIENSRSAHVDLETGVEEIDRHWYSEINTDT